MEITFFDRHKWMTDELHTEIMDCISELHFSDCSTHALQNWLFGFFDGFNYSKQIVSSLQFRDLIAENFDLASRIAAVALECASFPKQADSAS